MQNHLHCLLQFESVTLPKGLCGNDFSVTSLKGISFTDEGLNFMCVCVFMCVQLSMFMCVQVRI